jgi:hypothetical protein
MVLSKHASGPSSRLRRWILVAVVAAVAFEIVYVVAANLAIRSGALAALINKKPEKTAISWDAAATYFPGWVSVEGFTLTSQTRRNQVYLRVGEATGRISLVRLLAKTIQISGVDARDADFRYRPRLDRPPKEGQEAADAGPAESAEHWPEIPGLTNPPDPKPEDLYPAKRKKRPWTIAISGAEVEGPIKLAIEELALTADGRVSGSVRVVPRDSVSIRRGGLDLSRATVTLGPETLTDDLALRADLRFESFPARGAKLAEILGGISGRLALEGTIGEKAAVRLHITPGISVSGAGTVAADVVLDHGVLRSPSSYRLESGSYRLHLMDLEAVGTAAVATSTAKRDGADVTTARVAFSGFKFDDPVDGSVGVEGSGLEIEAEWDGFTIAGTEPASRVVLTIPPTRIADVHVLNPLLPSRSTLELRSGAGSIEGRLEVNGKRIATGTVDLALHDVLLASHDVPVRGDLTVHANLAEGDLPARRFDVSGTTIRLDKLAAGDKGGAKEGAEPWFCDVELASGRATLGAPIEADAAVRLKMRDTKGVMALLKVLGVGPGWLSKLPNIKHVDGTLDVGTGSHRVAFENVDLAADGFGALGWLVLHKPGTDGRLYLRFKGLDAGIAFDAGKTDLVVSKPKQWFAGQPTGPDDR